MTTTADKKINALAAFLDVKAGDVKRDNRSYFVDDEEYIVLTDKEASKAAREYIKDSLWAFNPGFILRHTPSYGRLDSGEYEDALQSLKNIQEKSCESAQGFIKAIIADIDDFVYDAIQADGRGCFIATYDGKEHRKDGFFIYRLN